MVTQKRGLTKTLGKNISINMNYELHIKVVLMDRLRADSCVVTVK